IEPAQEMAKVSNTTDNRNGRVHSRHIDPIVQKIPYTNLENVQARGFSAAARNFQERGKTSNLPKDEAKEGTGQRLLNMLRKTLKGSERKETGVTPDASTLVPFGDVVCTTEPHLQLYSDLFIRISINNVVKCTKPYSLLPPNDEKNAIIAFDEVKFFSVQVPRRQDNEKNNIYLELMRYDNTKQCLVLVGSVQVHLYEVIQKGCFTEDLQMLNKNTFICRMEVEFMFSYGNFGYGFSHQLKPLQKIIEPSMFMNVAPPPERTDPVTNVIIPQPIEYPAFLSPDLKVTVGAPPAAPQMKQPSVVRLEKLQQQPRERLEKMKKEYRQLSTWIEKASYLEGILTPRLEHKELKVINIIHFFIYRFFILNIKRNYESREKCFIFLNISPIYTPLTKEKAETIPSEFLDNKKGLTLSTLNHSGENDSNVVAPKNDASTKQMDSPFTTVPRLMSTEEDEIPSLEERQQEAVPERKMKNVLFSSEGKLKDRYQGLFKIDSSPSEVKLKNVHINSGGMKRRNLDLSPTEITWQNNNI
uniref:Cation channel sperm-associated targeting subunit tau C2 domain-containing protein n=1 Tax=Sus scrofa TaxID=9823 RepID=A0A8D0PK81_PIG